MHIIEDASLRAAIYYMQHLGNDIGIKSAFRATPQQQVKTPSPGLTWDIVKADDNGLSHITDDRGMKPFTSDPRCTWATSNENPGPREGG